MNKPLLAALALLALPAAAHAQQPSFSVQGVLGFNAELEGDKAEVKTAQGSQKQDLDDEDLESNLGLLATVDFPVRPKIRLGARLAYITAEGDDSEADITTIDIGGYGRYMFAEVGVKPFINLGLGLTHVKAEQDIPNFNEDEFTGFGWHVVAGGGVEAEMGGFNLIATLNYSRQTASPEGESDGITITFEDSVINRLLLSAGVAF